MWKGVTSFTAPLKAVSVILNSPKISAATKDAATVSTYPLYFSSQTIANLVKTLCGNVHFQLSGVRTDTRIGTAQDMRAVAMTNIPYHRQAQKHNPGGLDSTLFPLGKQRFRGRAESGADTQQRNWNETEDLEIAGVWHGFL